MFYPTSLYRFRSPWSVGRGSVAPTSVPSPRGAQKTIGFFALHHYCTPGGWIPWGGSAPDPPPQTKLLLFFLYGHLLGILNVRRCFKVFVLKIARGTLPSWSVRGGDGDIHLGALHPACSKNYRIFCFYVTMHAGGGVSWGWSVPATPHTLIQFYLYRF